MWHDAPGSELPALLGLHHVTAVTGDAAANVAFYTRVLGLRLVKKTVNQDDVTAYHLFYGDEDGSPGTELTFFHWSRAPRHRAGPGTIERIALAVADRAALVWWSEHLRNRGIPCGEIRDLSGRASLELEDPEGQRLELVAAPEAVDRFGRPWSASPVPPEVAVRGLYGVTLATAAIGATLERLTHLLGFRAFPGAATTLHLDPGGAGTEVRLVETRAGAGAVGIGGVHHLALRARDASAQERWRDRLDAARVPHSGIVDRHYFRSLYFHEPGGVLLEIATDGPGFATDEPLAQLGTRLALPPFLEPRRAAIEAALPPLETRATGNHT